LTGGKRFAATSVLEHQDTNSKHWRISQDLTRSQLKGSFDGTYTSELGATRQAKEVLGCQFFQS
jgi:hypothetical protein